MYFQIFANVGTDAKTLLKVKGLTQQGLSYARSAASGQVPLYTGPLLPAGEEEQAKHLQELDALLEWIATNGSNPTILEYPFNDTPPKPEDRTGDPVSAEQLRNAVHSALETEQRFCELDKLGHR